MVCQDVPSLPAVVRLVEKGDMVVVVLVETGWLIEGYG